jgi:hypothetical protein
VIATSPFAVDRNRSNMGGGNYSEIFFIKAFEVLGQIC